MSEATDEERFNSLTEQLFSAVQTGDFETVSRVITPVSENFLKSWIPGCDLICTALRHKHLIIAKFLIRKGLRTYKEKSVETILHVATLHGDIEILKMLRRDPKCNNVSVNNSEGLSVVAMLVKRIPVDFEVIKFLDYFINMKQSINNKSWPSGFTLLHFAAQFGNTDIIPILLSRNSHLNPKSKNSLTPLHVAAMHGQSQVINILLQSGAKHNMKDNDSKTPLCWAIEKGNMESIQILLKKTLGPRHSSVALRNDELLMYCAAIRGNKEVIELLIKNHAVVNLHSPSTGKTPLIIATENGNEVIVKILLENGAMPNEVQHSKYLRNSIHEESNQTPMHVATRIASLPIISMLLNSRYSTDSMFTRAGEQGFTPLHIAVEEGFKDIVALFLERGVPANLKTSNDLEALHIAAQKGDLGIVQLLLKHGAQVDTVGENMVDIRMYLDSEPESSTMYEVIPKDCYSDISIVSWKEVYTPLYIASYYGYVDVVRTLLDEGSNPNAGLKHGLTPLHAAAQKGHEEIFQLLLQRGAIFDSEGMADFLSSPLLAAVEGGHEGIVEILLKKGADVKRLFQLPSISILRAIEQVFDPKICHEIKREELKTGYTTLHFAAESGNKRIVEMILKNGLDVNAMSKNKSAPLDVAVKNGHTEVVRSLLEAGANVNFMCKWKFGRFKGNSFLDESNEGLTPLHIAVIKNNPNIVELLLQKGAFANISLKDFDYPLHLAVEVGNKDMITSLIKHGARVNSLCRKGCTPFSLAVKNNMVESAKSLIANGVPFDAKDQEGHFWLHNAIKMPISYEMVEFLLRCGADVNVRNEVNYTLLRHCISEASSFYVVNNRRSLSCRQLLKKILWLFRKFAENGADVNDWSVASGDTILHCTMRAEKFQEVDILLENGADVNITDEKGDTPLIYPMKRIKSFVDNFLLFRGDLSGQGRVFFLTDSEYPEPRLSDETVAPYRSIARSITRIIARLDAAGKYIHKQNLTTVESAFVYPYFALCQKEIEAMKLCKIANGVTYFDVLMAEERMLSFYARNAKIMENLQDESHQKRFPLYGEFLKSRIQRGMRRYTLVEQSYLPLRRAFGFKVPRLIAWEVTDYLTLKELHNLCLACMYWV